jgi:Bifunctional PLP-dependent enzyme with beta-cystathionase and maltose regulon repressor activities
MKTIFDTVVDRGIDSGVKGIKWQGYESLFPGYRIESENSIPMWVADMDFPCPPEVVEAVVNRARHGIYGYVDGVATGALIEAAVAWFDRRYNLKWRPEWMLFSPGVVPGLNTAVQEFSQAGQGVIIQPPVYYPFRQVLEINNRLVVNNQLIKKDGSYEMNFEELESLARVENNVLMILCNPHNPVGRVWRPDELEKVSRICHENNVILFSDEIHCDLMLKGSVFTSVGFFERYLDNSIFAHAPSKTFNLAGLQMALISVPDKVKRESFRHRMHINSLPDDNAFAVTAGEAAYRFGDDYVDRLGPYIEKNVRYVIERLGQELREIEIIEPEGTYMLWVDFSRLNSDDDAVRRTLFERARVIVNPGDWFGPGGQGFVRMNLACPHSTVVEAVSRITTAFQLK